MTVPFYIHSSLNIGIANFILGGYYLKLELLRSGEVDTKGSCRSLLQKLLHKCS